MDARQISAASETVSWEIHRKSECVMIVVPKLAAGSQADYEVVQPRPPGYRYTDSLPLGSGSLESFRIDTPDGSSPTEIKISRSPDTLLTEWSATSTEMAGGSPPADIDICESPDTLQTEWSTTYMEMAGRSPPADRDICDSLDTLQTEWSATSTEIAGGSPPADIDICDGPDRLQTEISAITMTMSGESPPVEIRNSRSPDRQQKEMSVTSTEMAGGSPPPHTDICESPDRLQTVISVTSTEMAGGNPPADRDNCESPELLQRTGSVTAAVSDKWMERSVIKWSKMLMPCVSGVSIDTLLFSRVDSPLCHRYRLVGHTWSHTAFRGTYLKHLWSFIEEKDSAGRRQGPRRCNQRVSARMVKSTDKSVSRGR